LQLMDFVMPVPMHRVKLRERPFNQAAVLASSLAKKTGIPYSGNNIVRTRSDKPQIELSRVARLNTVRGAFRIRRPRTVRDKSILLIDDVFTTGATVNECARVLREAGAKYIEVLTLAQGNNMKILRDYILREMFPPLVLSIFIITFALLIGNLVKLADFVINKGVDLSYVFRIFMYLIPNLLNITIPMAVLTATLLAFGRLSSDNEITAMRATGISFIRIAMPAITLGLIFSLISIPLNDKVVPRAHYKTRMLIKELGMRKPTAYMEAGTFIRGFKDYILFIYEINTSRTGRLQQYKDISAAERRAHQDNSGKRRRAHTAARK